MLPKLSTKFAIPGSSPLSTLSLMSQRISSDMIAHVIESVEFVLDFPPHPHGPDITGNKPTKTKRGSPVWALSSIPSFHEFVHEIVSSTSVETQTFLSTLVYFERMRTKLADKIWSTNCHLDPHLFFVAVLFMAAHHLEDPFLNHFDFDDGLFFGLFSRDCIQTCNNKLSRYLGRSPIISENEYIRVLCPFLFLPEASPLLKHASSEASSSTVSSVFSNLGTSTSIFSNLGTSTSFTSMEDSIPEVEDERYPCPRLPSMDFLSPTAPHSMSSLSSILGDARDDVGPCSADLDKTPTPASYAFQSTLPSFDKLATGPLLHVDIRSRPPPVSAPPSQPGPVIALPSSMKSRPRISKVLKRAFGLSRARGDGARSRRWKKRETPEADY